MDSNFIEINGVQREYLIERKNTKTLKYKVYPDLTIKVIVPESITIEEIQSRILKRKSWIRNSLEFYLQNKNNVVNELLSGSTIKYLGKQFRLKIVDTPDESIKLIGKYLVVNVKNKDNKRIEALIDEWYREHAVIYFNKIITKCLKKVGKYDINQPTMFIRKMKSRWGSCIQSKNKIIINSNLIKESTMCIEYVIMHELCHLKFPSHNTQFYTFLSIVMPDWRLRKGKLERLLL